MERAAEGSEESGTGRKFKAVAGKSCRWSWVDCNKVKSVDDKNSTLKSCSKSEKK